MSSAHGDGHPSISLTVLGMNLHCAEINNAEPSVVENENSLISMESPNKLAVRVHNYMYSPFKWEKNKMVTIAILSAYF